MTVGIFDSLVTLAITLAQLPAQRQSFGVLYVPTPGTCSFSETVKRYANPTEVATSYAASEISATTKAALDAVFALDRSPSQIAVAKVAEGTAQDATITIGGTILEGDTFTVNVDGIASVTVTAPATPTADDVGTLLFDALELLPLATTLVAFNRPTSDNIIEALSRIGTIPMQYSVSTTSSAGTIEVEIATPAATPASALDTVLAADADWWGLITELKTTGWQDAVSAWAETNARYYWAQSADTRLESNDANGAAGLAKVATRAYTHVVAHDDDSEDLALLAMARWLSYDPDLFYATPTRSVLAGITPHASLTSSTASNLDDDHVSYYEYFRGTACFAGAGVRSASGMTALTRLTIDWLEARIGESLAAWLLAETAKGRVVPYTDAGFAQAQARVQAQLDRAVELGRLRVVLDENTGERISPKATVPRVADVTEGQAAAGLIPITFRADTAGEATSITVNGYLADLTVS